MTIWEFKIEFKDEQRIEMPVGATILDIQKSDTTNGPVLWALVDPEAKKELRTFHLQTTGQTFSTLGKKYLGTFQYQKGIFVGHLFEKG